MFPIFIKYKIMGLRSSRHQNIHGGDDNSMDASKHSTEFSSGFHLFEVHSPSVGGSAIAVLLIIGLIIGGYYVIKKCQQRAVRQVAQ